MNVTPASLEAEWMGNLQRLKRRTVRDLTGVVLRELAAGPDEAAYGLLGLKPHQLIKRKDFERHYGPMLAFVWRQAVLATHPAHAERFAATLERSAAELPGMNSRRLGTFFNDLDFLKVITDNFAEDGFISAALHVVQRVHGEIEQRPENLESAVGLGLWMDERFQSYRDTLVLAEIVITG
ncbi:MAG: hypothetical protein HQM00_02005 [Magnetococcales bacterium]|nr:hypothetical protein [Magnetococcales bacterium]